MHPANYWISSSIQQTPPMDLHIFKTDIRTKKRIKALEPILNNHPVIDSWTVDTNDVDKILRIETSQKINECDIVNLVRTYGFYCEPLTD